MVVDDCCVWSIQYLVFVVYNGPIDCPSPFMFGLWKPMMRYAVLCENYEMKCIWPFFTLTDHDKGIVLQPVYTVVIEIVAIECEVAIQRRHCLLSQVQLDTILFYVYGVKRQWMLTHWRFNKKKHFSSGAP